MREHAKEWATLGVLGVVSVVALIATNGLDKAARGVWSELDEQSFRLKRLEKKVEMLERQHALEVEDA